MQNKLLVKKILSMYKKDQAMRWRAFREKWPLKKRMRIRDMDLSHIKILKQIIAKYGWPTFDLVGKRGEKYFWLLVQHADEDKNFQKQCLTFLRKAVQKGQASPSSEAYLTDRVLLADGKKQKFGTQFTVKNGTYIPKPLLNPKNVNILRRKFGLGTIEANLKEMNKQLKKH